ncbi:FAD binding domain-containing protein [Colletotrichum phormii]|uniref:FAD binding domain-containing protein n=1 Tax=Colletotrichum phormii TaxID=359342 RepID=A0AAI9ZM36_9PEZI|nr:FAD binding domain-containing protein [Colletotrichum phormii]KAK1634512.1 FAD binding domain-containing protein [Colletotrichum phormii]
MTLRLSTVLLYALVASADIASAQCKVYPGDSSWPSDEAWAALNERVENRLLKPRPQAAACYNGPEYDEAACATMTANWTNSYTHLDDPIEKFSPVYQGLTCLSPNIYDSGNCTMGGFPWYVINATSARHVQEGVRFAKGTGVRLVVKNTGHDFSGKSGGGESLSIWTHHLKSIEYIEDVTDDTEGYSVASEYGRVVGGEGQTVGVMGGYIQGGGHSPLSSIYGTGADQALAFEVVTADGGACLPDVPTTASAFKFSTADGISNETFWSGVRSYFDSFIHNADNGTYSYFLLLHNNPSPGNFLFQMTPFFAPNKTAEEVTTLLDPWFSKLHGLGISFDPNITEYDSFYPAWKDFFPLEVVEKVNATFEAIRTSLETNHVFVGFNIKAISPDGPDNAVNPAWRENILFALQSVRWSVNATAEEILEARKGFTFGDMQRWRDVSPGAGSYLAESDRMEPNFQQSFYGNSKYPCLLELKRKWDPEDVFYAATAVGSEFWSVVTEDGLPHENGRLCRVIG